MGLMVLDESFDSWQHERTNDYHLLFNDWHEKDLRDLIRRDRNHPSVIIWSIGNEIPEQGTGGSSDRHANRAPSSTRKTPPARPPPPATCTQPAYNGFQNIVDIFGLQLQAGIGFDNHTSIYIRFHKASPTQFVFAAKPPPPSARAANIRFPSPNEKSDGLVPDAPSQFLRPVRPAWATPPDAISKQDQIRPLSAGNLSGPALTTSASPPAIIPRTEHAKRPRTPRPASPRASSLG